MRDDEKNKDRPDPQPTPPEHPNGPPVKPQGDIDNPGKTPPPPDPPGGQG